jgi:hypothetical protein
MGTNGAIGPVWSARPHCVGLNSDSSLPANTSIYASGGRMATGIEPGKGRFPENEAGGPFSSRHTHPILPILRRPRMLRTCPCRRGSGGRVPLLTVCHCFVEAAPMSTERSDLLQPSGVTPPAWRVAPPGFAFFSRPFSLRPWLGSFGSSPALSSLLSPSSLSESLRISFLLDCPLLPSRFSLPCLLPSSSPFSPCFLPTSSPWSPGVVPSPTASSCLLSLSFVVLHV